MLKKLFRYKNAQKSAVDELKKSFGALPKSLLLITLHESGIEVENDIGKAPSFYEKSAEQGNCC